MRASRVCFATVVALAILPGVADAQLVDSPPGSIGGLFGGHRPPEPNRPSQRLTMTFDVSGGNGELVHGGVTESDGSGDFGGIGAAAIQYWAGRTVRYVDVSASSYIFFDSPNRPIGSARAFGLTNVGQRNSLYMSVLMTYEPSLLSEASTAPAPNDLTSAVPVDVVSEVDLSNPAGVIDQRWLDTRASAGLQHEWTPRQRSDVRYERSRRYPIGDQGYDSQSQLIALGHAWSFSPRGEVQLSYRLEQNRLAVEVPRRPLRFHIAETGVAVQKPLGAGRGVSVVLRGGAAYAGGEANSFTAPVASAIVQAALSRRWSISGEVRHDVSVLEGLSPEGFANDAIAARTTFRLGRRVIVGVSVDRAWGTSLADGAGSFDWNTATAEVRYGIAPWCGVFSSYTYYQHRYRDIASVPEGFPAHYNRRSVWFGLNLWVPLFGTF